MVLSAGIDERIVRSEFTVSNHLFPVVGPQMILYDRLAVLVVDNGTFINHNTALVPLACRFCILRHCRNQVVQRCGHSVAVLAQTCIGMTLVVEYLILGRGFPDRFALCLLRQIEHAAVGTLRNLPFELQFEVLELPVEDNVATVLGARFAGARTVDFDSSVIDCPCRRHVGTIIPSPTFERFSVEQAYPFPVVLLLCA